MTAFAVAAAVALLAPRLRWPVLGLAAVIAFSRVYLGVHFWLDVLVGAVLGLAIGLSLAWSLRSWRARHAGAASAAGTGPPGWVTTTR
jgi:membrane-associated phospholipid phosphatase